VGASMAFLYTAYASAIMAGEQSSTEVWQMMLVSAVGGVLAFLLPLVVRMPPLVRATVVCALLALGVIGYPVHLTLDYSALDPRTRVDARHDDFIVHRTRQVSEDGSLAIVIPGYFSQASTIEMCFIDYRHQHEVVQRFAPDVMVGGFIEDHAALLLQQKPGETKVALLRWDIRDNAVTPLADLLARRGSVERAAWEESDNMWKRNIKTAIQPGGQYALLSLPSVRGDGNSLKIGESGTQLVDLWQVDLRHGQATLLQPAVADTWQSITWQGNTATLSGRNFGVTRLTLHVREEGP